MKAWIIGLACLCLTFMPLSAHADTKTETNAIQTLTTIASQVYEAASNRQLDLAVEKLNSFNAAWEKLNGNNGTVSEVAVRAITASKEKLSRELENNGDENAINEASVEFRLAVDALVNSEHPLWLGMKDQVLGAFSKLQKDVESDETTAFQVDLNKFLDIYQMVYPSMTIDIKPDILKMINSQIDHLVNQRMIVIQDKSTYLPHIKDIHDELMQIFGGTTEASGILQSPGILPPSLFIGGLVILTLLYVVWKKYKGENKTNTHVPVTK